MTARDIAVTGIGLITPAGTDADTTWRTVCAGTPTAALDPDLGDVPIPLSCRVPPFDGKSLIGPQVWRMDRFTHLALIAAHQAVRDAGLDPAAWDGARVAVVVGVGYDSKDLVVPAVRKLIDGAYESLSPLLIPRTTTNAAAAEICIALGAHGPSMAVTTACASGATALGTARDLLLAGRCDIALAGGAEAPCHPLPSACFAQMGALSGRLHDPQGASRPFDADRDGFVLAEGAGLMVLERAADARARGARPRAYFSGYGSSTDGYHYAAPHPDGTGIERAFTAALGDAGLGTADIGHVNAHGTGTPMNDRIEGAALARIFHGRPPTVTSTKGVTGHTLGAAGAIEAALAALTLEHQTIPPTANLDQLDPDIALDVVAKAPRPQRMEAVASNSCGFGGHNTVLVLKRA
ncbi:beta-ketoacyl-[acyl-carrier-protein] synthase family protein [Streptomyces sp. RS10V-4]|uniref:beta-ketoacyl-[acyl-carrier-protein] synthase family protein n=1 Tax=Streptomyces rhizoryzae TaxID=2932493 RepID=UPI002004234E|nr:beta-ketoacyl-[acyl-carrier-protein] synthase family protein [Streptomyces rhizoryzae]MCK7622220.1 beta-ketoacyl-[acyl-carrier-protein] synthase family protein [Streptomyces rhizoryzae]